MYIAASVEDIAKSFEIKMRQLVDQANREKPQTRIRLRGEAYAWEQAARVLRDLKWAADVERLGFDAPYAIPRSPKIEGQGSPPGPENEGGS